MLLLKYYQEKKFDKAKVMLDSVLSACPNQKDNPYYWHLSGFVNYFVFKQVDNKSPISKARDIAIESFKKSLELEKKRDNIKFKKLNYLESKNFIKIRDLNFKNNELQSFKNIEVKTLNNDFIIRSMDKISIIGKKFELWLDGGHNLDAAGIIKTKIQSWKQQEVIIIMGMMNGKSPV